MLKLKKKLFVIIMIFPILVSYAQLKESTPYWLMGFKQLYKENPNKASKAWFKDAKFGMFVHLNLASLLERGKDDYYIWAHNTRPVPDSMLNTVGLTREQYRYAENKNAILYEQYLLKEFSANSICKLAKEAGMSYITFTTHHLGGGYNFETSLSDFNSLKAPCKKDLVAEMAAACKSYGLALFLYVPPQISKTTDAIYEHNKTYLIELLTQYGPVAGIWFDGIGGYNKNPEDYEHLADLHALVKNIQPQALISFKEGALGDEDFISPEHFMLPFEYSWKDKGINKRFQIRVDRWKDTYPTRWEYGTKNKLREVNTVMQKCIGREDTGSDGGWINDETATHYNAEQVYNWLTYSRYTGSNLLMNIGPRRDGSIHPDDVKALREVGQMIKTKGWPKLYNLPHEH